jgi:hypothetical protein
MMNESCEPNHDHLNITVQNDEELGINSNNVALTDRWSTSTMSQKGKLKP